MLFQELPEETKVILRDVLKSYKNYYIGDREDLDLVMQKLADFDIEYANYQDLEIQVGELTEEVEYLKDELSDCNNDKDEAIEKLGTLERKLNKLSEALQILE